MSRLMYLRPEAILAIVYSYGAMQQRIIELQEEVIELRRRIDEMTPRNVPDEDVFWHLSSGLMSEEAANSEDLTTVRRFQKWNIDLAKKYVKPYVSPKVYGEVLNQMTRGLSARIAELETKYSKDNQRPIQLRVTMTRKRKRLLDDPVQLDLLETRKSSTMGK